jgi:hypothetical protein
MYLFQEGALTARRIYQHAVNTGAANGTVRNPKLANFVAQNLQWMQSMYSRPDSPRWYWSHVELVLAQLQGVYQGYRQGACVGEDSLTYNE